jgi:hypothetical protein
VVQARLWYCGGAAIAASPCCGRTRTRFGVMVEALQRLVSSTRNCLLAHLALRLDAPATAHSPAAFLGGHWAVQPTYQHM